VFLAIGAWEGLASFYAGGEESLDGMRMANVMGCLYRGVPRTRMAPKRHLRDEKYSNQIRINFFG
jgi:hypothetical protein